ncbi:MAG: threonylcarbamoyl-AMP synthase [Rikenellaceae bacterium]|jgi:L-threonylcarbamoyladenylate synthase|nr:threonylcarbamoyl-AMP synthase [Rikenellaceae bacterium]
MLDDQIAQALEILRRGGIILYPTDTVWGIGCDATNAAAIDRIYTLKQRVDKKSMIVLIDRPDSVSRYAQTVPEIAWQLFEVADKPLTLILPQGRGVAENLLPEDGSIAIRIPDHEFCKKLTYKLGRPLVSTSANLSGEPAPVTFSEIPAEIKKGVDGVIDPVLEGKPTRKPSSIISLGPGGEIKILRE